MKRIFLLIFLTGFLPFHFLHAQLNPAYSLDNKWIQVEELINKGLPESAEKVLSQMFEFAENSGLMSEQLKIELTRYRLQTEKNPDSWQHVLIHMEKMIQKFPEITLKRIATFLLSDFYNTYYQNNSYLIDRRTNTLTELPEDISTWTRDQFKRKILELQHYALNVPELLLNIPISKYAELFHFDKSKVSFPPYLYDFMALKHTETLTLFNEKERAAANIRDLIKITKKDSKSAILPFYELQLLELTTDNQADIQYLMQLDSIAMLYCNNPAVVEILHAKARWYMMKSAKEGNKRIAYRISEEGIKKFPDYERIGLLKAVINEISAKQITLHHTSVLGSNQILKIDASTTNITEMILEIYQSDLSPEKYYSQSLSGNNPIDSPGKLIDKKVFSFPFNPDFDTENSNFEVELPEYGIYHVRAYPKEKTNRSSIVESTVIVSDFTYMKRKMDKDKTGIYILDRTSGKRIKGAKIQIFDFKWTGSGYEALKIKEVVTNRNGYAEYTSSGNYYSNFLVISKENDRYFVDKSFAGIIIPPPPPSPELEISMFSDRSLYRPGQTLYMKLIAYKSEGKHNSVIERVKIPVTLYDANGTEISSKELITNEFGSASTDFFIPVGRLNGTWSINANDLQHLSFQVEEYKLPGFEVIMKKPVEEVSFNREINIAGEIKSYAGYALPESSIQYKIYRMTHPFWRFFPRRVEQLVGSGLTKTDSKGTFNVLFTPEKDSEIVHPHWGRHSYIYRIVVDATDLKGETQQGNIEIAVSEQSLFINATINEIIPLHETSVIPVEVVNIEGVKLSKKLTYKLIRLAETEEYSEEIAMEDFTFTDIETVLQGVFQSSEARLKVDFSRFKPGRYRLVLNTNDDQGKYVSFEKVLVLYNPLSKKPPVKSYAWQGNQRIECEPGKNVRINFGTSLHRAHILMEVLHGQEIVSSQWIVMNNAVKTFTIPFQKKYSEGLEVNFSFVRNGRLFVRNFVITANRKDRTITPKLTVFRDKLKPGEKAEWSVTIPDTKQKAELMLSMYDASLDFQHPHTWIFNPIKYHQLASAPRWNSTSRHTSSAYGIFYNHDDVVPEINAAILNHWQIHFYSGHNFNIRKRTFVPNERMALTESQNILNTASGSIADMKISENAEYDMRNKNNVKLREVVELLPGLLDSKPLQLRTNFNETAFFYPQVYADSTGNFRFSFTMPESLTRWNLKMLAHTRDLLFGQNIATVTTSKELMIRLNKPRFVRESDNTELTASIVNLSEKELKIRAVIRLTDANDGEKINIQTAKEQIVVLQAGESKAVTWVIGQLYNRNLLVCTIEAESEYYRDGEQHLLAVLPDRILVTETKAFTVKGNNELNLSFDDWKATAGKVATSSLWVEFTANPVWYALKALPVLAETIDESTSNVFISWYSRKKALQILNENPLIKQTFDQMTALGNLNDLLQSPLSKNEALKTIILKETPWVNAAKNETEQMQRIMSLFNNNNQHDITARMFEKLTERQMNSGGFGWYPGMPESRWISQIIAEGLTQIHFEKDEATNTLIDKLLNYLDYALNHDYQEIKKHADFDTKRMAINTLQLQYLLIRTHFKEYEMKQEYIEAYHFFLRQTKEHHHHFNLYEKALAARVLHRLNKYGEARELIQSLLETAIKSIELGMYWAHNKSGFYWSERPVSVHAAIMQAIHEVGGRPAELQEMKIWLMRQKQTQQWNSPIASLHAIAAITDTGDRLAMNAQSYNIKINNLEISNKQLQPGAGFVLHKMNEPVIPVKLSVSPPAETPVTSLAWGAVNWQYFTELKDVTASGSGLKLSKTYYLSHTLNNETRLIPLNHPEAQQLKTGDRIVVRLIVNTDRDLEFVALKDMRSACLEPLDQISGTQWKEQLLFYRTSGDASTRYYFQHLPKGSYVFEDVYFINSTGDYSGGMASIQCLYAPEFVAYAPGQRISIKR